MVDHNAVLPTVTVIIPMLNEAHFIERCVRSVLEQEYQREKVSVVVVDGGSRDNSQDIVRGLAMEDPRVRLLGGNGLNCPAALNCGIAATKSAIICKVDAHGYLAPDFIRVAVECLNRDARLMCVGGPIHPLAQSLVGEANSLARTSRFGVGHGVNTFGPEEQLVETVQCGVYRRQIFDKIGAFDEMLQFGEDEEINWRIIKEGYRILFTPLMQFYYFPRESFRSFFLQYYRYGRARVHVIKKHPMFFRVKHIMPSGLILCLILTLVASQLSSDAMRLLLVSAITYLFCAFIASVLRVLRTPRTHLALIPLLLVSFACLHFGYGFGFLRGIRDCFSPRRL
jgi:cellulose synthase/poly-beta-1,6-N-acetylglucosamine synthase-like glycosyltransferase